MGDLAVEDLDGSGCAGAKTPKRPCPGAERRKERDRERAARHRPLVHAGVGSRLGLPGRADLDLGVEERCRHDHQQRSRPPTDVEDRRPAGSGSGGLDPVQLGVSNPLSGMPRYGKWSMYRPLPGTEPPLNWADEKSLTAAAAPSGVKVVSTSGMVAPAMARISMVATSSNTRRPFGNPARSPPRMPFRLGDDAGGIAMLRRNRSAGVEPVLFWNPAMIPDGIPVSRIASRSTRAAVYAASFMKTPG